MENYTEKVVNTTNRTKVTITYDAVEFTDHQDIIDSVSREVAQHRRFDLPMVVSIKSTTVTQSRVTL